MGNMDMKEAIIVNQMKKEEAFILAGRAMALADIILEAGYVSKNMALAALGVPKPIEDDRDLDEKKDIGLEE